MKFINKVLYIAIICLCASVSANIALAGGPDHSIAPSKYDAKHSTKTDPLVLNINNVDILTLGDDIKSIILSNPDIVELIIEDSRRIILRPLKAGITGLTVLNENGRIFYKRDILVTNKGDNIVRVKRICTDGNCVPNDTYFCPNGCHNITPITPPTSSNNSDATPAAQTLPAPANSLPPANAIRVPDEDIDQ